MALKKSELYSSLWSSCDELRGGMDASQYKDYVLVLLFIKYVSDKYAGVPYAPITIPAGASFKDMVALKGKPDIGDQINKKIIGPLANANKLSDMPDFNEPGKLGSGKEMVERLTNLIAIFENKSLDFSKNRAEGDDILGDAYEYLMRHFATESGKSKGQFYTPAEVSRVIAQIIGIHEAATTSATTVYDPTCGSGSLLLKVGDEAGTKVTLYGQEKDAATSTLARMNMILHNNPTALIEQGNTLSVPKFKDGGTLKTFDYVVANPPFSDKRWSTGIDPAKDEFDRFKHFGVPPAKQGDYAYLLHIVRSLKSTGKGACVLPHGVLFRSNAEADIRRALVRKGYIKGIIGLPPNLFYGTGIPACIIVVDKQEAHARKGIFMIDASAGFMKDGPKNRLRAQDIHKIVDVFNRRLEAAKYSRMVPVQEIERNEFNLNLPRYIDSQQPEDLQDIEGHLCGGIPERDVDALCRYWKICPNLRQVLFNANRPGYVDLAVEKATIKSTIYGHPEFAAFIARMNAHFTAWRQKTEKTLRQLKAGCHPKQIIVALSEDLLAHYASQPLIDKYDVYQHLMDYWAETMQDDCYAIAADGWKAETYRIIEKDKKGKEKDKGWACDLVPKALIVATYFASELEAITNLEGEIETTTARMTELEEEHGGDEGLFSQLEKVNKANVNARLTEIRGDNDDKDEIAALDEWLPVYDSTNGQAWPASLFVSVLGASSYAYAEATRDQQLQAWIQAHIHALEFYGGAPTLTVPDNTKTAVTRACRYDPDLNPTYQEFAIHYGMGVVPARPYRPRDKAKVESGVQVCERWIIAALRHRKFFHLAELNQAIRELLVRMNERPFRKRDGSRSSLFHSLEKPALTPLPAERFDMSQWERATVNIDYHIAFDENFYSVPYTLVQQVVEVRSTPTTVEIFHKGNRVASHLRDRRRGQAVTQNEHRPKSHQAHLEWPPSRMLNWARSIGPNTVQLCDRILNSKPHPEMGYRSCLGIIRLAQQYSAQRVEAAAERAVLAKACRYQSVKSILKNSLDTVPLSPPPAPVSPPLSHDNVRGAEYFDQGGPTSC